MSVNKVNQSTGELSPIAGGTLYADAPVGSIQAYGGATAPWGWLLCQGQAVSRATYAELFGVIGTSFGTGDGSTTFNIPDLRGEFLRGAGTNSHSGQGSGGSIGQHQDATAVPDIYTAAAGTVIVSPGKDAIWSNTDAEVSASSGYKTVALSTAGGTNIPSNYMVRPTNTSVNFIIKATSIALPSDFASAVDDAIDAKIVDTIADGNMKAATSNAVYDALPKTGSFRTQGISVGNNIIDITSYTPQSGILPSITAGCIFFIQGFWNQIDYDANIVCDNNKIYIKATKDNPGGLSIVWIKA